MPARLTLRLEANEPHAPVRFDAFADMAAHAASLLAELDLARAGEQSISWVVRKLEIGSATIEIEAIPLNPLLDLSEGLSRDFASGLAEVAASRRPASFSDIAWEHTRAMVEILHDGIGRLEVDAGDAPVVLTRDVVVPEGEPDDLAVSTLEPSEQEAVSTIEGSLETVNGHDPKQMYFAVWDVLYRRRIRCDFPPSLLDEVRHGLLERVRVHGLVVFDQLGHPVRVADVRAIQVLDRNISRPGPAALRGLAPGITGGLDAAEWVRRIRDA
jgi:hypothetical protein